MRDPPSVSRLSGARAHAVAHAHVDMDMHDLGRILRLMHIVVRAVVVVSRNAVRESVDGQRACVGG